MRLPRRLWRILRSRWFRRALVISPFALMIGIVVFYSAVNWWGRARFEQARDDMRSKGFAASYAEVLATNPAPEDDVNTHPAVTGFHASKFDYFTLWEEAGHDPRAIEKQFGDPVTGRPTLLSPLSPPAGEQPGQAVLARRLLDILSPSEQAAADLADACHRPEVGLLLKEYDGVKIFSIPQLVALGSSQFFVHRSRLRAIAGDTEGAMLDAGFLPAALRAQRQRSHSMLANIIATGGAASFSILTWELSQQAAIDDAALRQLDSWLAELDTQQPFANSYELELVYLCEMGGQFFGPVTTLPWEKMDWEFDWGQSPAGWGRTLSSWRWQIEPVGFRWADTATAIERVDREFLHTPDGLRRQSFTPAEADRFQALYENCPSVSTTVEFFDTSIADSVWMAVGPATHRLHKVQAMLRLARLTIAVERHRRAHDGNPPNLPSLVPEFLEGVPLDPNSGEPLTLTQQADGSLRILAPGRDKASRIEWIIPPRSAP